MNAGDTDVEDDTMFQPAKRAKKVTLYQPLHRTAKLVNHIKGKLAKQTLETILEAMLINESKPNQG